MEYKLRLNNESYNVDKYNYSTNEFLDEICDLDKIKELNRSFYNTPRNVFRKIKTEQNLIINDKINLNNSSITNLTNPNSNDKNGKKKLILFLDSTDIFSKRNTLNTFNLISDPHKQYSSDNSFIINNSLEDEKVFVLFNISRKN